MIANRLRLGLLLGLLPWSALAGQAAPPPLEAFAGLPFLQRPQLSPDGSRFAAIMPVEGRKVLVVIATDKGTGIAPTLARADHWQIAGFAWKTNQELLLVLRSNEPFLKGAARTSVAKLVRFDLTQNRILDYDPTTADYNHGVGHYLPSTAIQRLVGGAERSAVVNAYNQEFRYFPKHIDGITSWIEDDRLIRFDLALDKILDYDRTAAGVGGQFIDLLPGDTDHIMMTVYGAAIKLGLSDASLSMIHDPVPDVAVWFDDETGAMRAAEGYRDYQFLHYALGDDGRLSQFKTTRLGKGERFVILGVAKDPTHLIVLSDHDTGRMAAYEYDPSRQSYVKQLAAADRYDVGLPIYWAGRAVGLRFPRTVYFDPANQSLGAMLDKALPNSQNVIVDLAQDHSRALVMQLSPQRPTGLYLLSLGQKAALQFIGSEYPALEKATLAPVKRVHYAARDGQQIEAFLTVPANRSGLLPFVVLPHDGPAEIDSGSFDFLAQFLASRGYGVIQPEFRGSKGYGAAFERAGDGQWGGVMQTDVDDATKWAIDQHLADPHRICIIGAGYGGYVALFGAGARPDLYRCAAAWAPITDLPAYVRHLEIFDWKAPEIPGIANPTASLAAVSPVNRIDKISIPLLIGHGADDVRVPVEQSHEMVDALKAAGKPVEAAFYAEDDHDMILEATRCDFLGRLEAFLAHNIGPGG